MKPTLDEIAQGREVERPCEDDVCGKRVDRAHQSPAPRVRTSSTIFGHVISGGGISDGFVVRERSGRSDRDPTAIEYRKICCEFSLCGLPFLGARSSSGPGEPLVPTCT
jgi:hypothetical protein